MKYEVLDGIPDLHGFFSVLYNETKPVHFLLMCSNAIKWVQKTGLVYDSKTQMVRDAHFCVWILIIHTIIT